MKRTKVLTLLLAIALLATSLGAAAFAGDLPVSQEVVTYDALVQLNPGATAWEELEIPTLFTEMTNIAFNYSYYNYDEFVQKLNLDFMSGAYYDVIFGGGVIEAKDDEAYGKEGFVIDLKPLIEEYMPNLQKLFEDHPDAKAASTASTGAIYGMPTYYTGIGGNPQVLYMDPYWLEVTGRDEIVKSTDELWDLLVDIKAVMDSGDYLNPNDEAYPLGFRSTSGTSTFSNVLMHGFTGTLISLDAPFAAPDNTTIEFMVEHPGYRAAMEFMREMHRANMIDPECYVMDNPTWTARLNNCNYAIFGNSPTGQNADLVRGGGMALHPLTSEYNDTYRITYENTIMLNMFMITDVAEQPELLAQWADFFFEDDNFKETSYPTAIMAQLGVYGEQWEFTDETEVAYKLTDKPDEPGTIMDWTYLYSHYTPNYNGYPGRREFSYMMLGSRLYEEKQITTAANMYPYCTTDTQMPPRARFTEAELESIVTIRTDLELYLRENWVAFTTDQKSIEDEWDNFVSECYRIGAQQIVDVYQVAYDRWNEAME